MSLSGEERLRLWIERAAAGDQVRLERLRKTHPGCDEIALRRLWFEETYPGEFSAEYLDRVEAWMREVEVRG